MGALGGTGFRGVKCPVCNDHTQRAGFKIDDAGMFYGCFNCGEKFSYERDSAKLSKNGYRILECFGISRDEISQALGGSFFLREREIITVEDLKPKYSLATPEVQLPPRSYPIGSPEKPEFQAPIIAYLQRRGVDPLAINAHFSLDPQFLNRVILPCYREDKIIFWQARAINPDDRPRFKSPAVPKEAVLWGFNNIHHSKTQPLFISEGIFNAYFLDGVALLGSKLNQAKVELLNKTRRDKVVIVDRDTPGGALGHAAISNGWKVSFVPVGCSDVNDSVLQFGLLYTIRYVVSHITEASTIKTTSGVSVQSTLALDMELALAKLQRI